MEFSLQSCLMLLWCSVLLTFICFHAFACVVTLAFITCKQFKEHKQVQAKRW
jgi:ABC-type bacteriocin/lantibiotic exporter with double-glycine peptidase domain